MERPSEHLPTSGKSPETIPPGQHADPGTAPPPTITLPVGLAERLTRVLGLSKVWQWLVQPRVIGVVIVGDATKLPESEESRRGSDYRVINVDLGTARDLDSEPILKDTTVSAVWIDDVSAGAVASIRIGKRDPLTVKSAGQSYEVQPPEEVSVGVANAAQPGLFVKVAVGFGVRAL